MRYRLLVAVFAVCLGATAETLSVQQLVAFVRNAVKTNSDKDIAGFLAHARLSERLDAGVLEDLEGLGVGPRTRQALEKLKSESENLATAKPVLPPAAPRPIPIPNSEEQAAIIDDIREYALAYSKNLPDFICTQVTRRFAAGRPGTKYAPRDTEPSWQALDVLQIRLSYFGQKEQYKLVLINNRVTNQDYRELGGATATGDFGSLLRDIFEPGSHATFEWDHWGTLRDKRVMAFRYRVTQGNSQWHLVVKDTGDHFVPGYHGVVEVEPDTHAVMRVTLIADDIPANFPIKEARTTLDYAYQEISGRTFILPLKSQVIMGDGEVLQKLDEEFHLYRKYSADSEVKYDSDLLPPLPDDQTKETKEGAPKDQKPPVTKKQ